MSSYHSFGLTFYTTGPLRHSITKISQSARPVEMLYNVHAELQIYFITLQLWFCVRCLKTSLKWNMSQDLFDTQHKTLNQLIFKTSNSNIKQTGSTSTHPNHLHSKFCIHITKLRHDSCVAVADISCILLILYGFPLICIHNAPHVRMRNSSKIYGCTSTNNYSRLCRMNIGYKFNTSKSKKKNSDNMNP